MAASLRPYLETATEAAYIGGRILARAGKKARVPSFKGATDLVTATDRASERAIQRFLAKRFPTHGFIGEEGGRRDGAEWRWIVDPLDGTMNFAHGVPYYDVSVGLEHNGRVVAGAIYDPIMDKMYTAARGMGARCNGRRIHVSKRKPMRQTLLATGFSSALLDTAGNGPGPRAIVREQFRRFEDFCLAARGVRRPGAAALDLAWIASGIFDGFWEGALMAWDVAAGWVIVEEAGGTCTDFAGKSPDIFAGEFVASNGLIHEEMLRVIRGKKGPA